MEAPSSLSLLPFRFVMVSMGISCAISVALVLDFFLAEALVAGGAEVTDSCSGVGVAGMRRETNSVFSPQELVYTKGTLRHFPWAT